MPEVSPRLRNAPAHYRARARALRSLRRPDPPAPLGDPVHPEGRRLVRHRLSVRGPEEGHVLRLRVRIEGVDGEGIDREGVDGERVEVEGVDLEGGVEGWRKRRGEAGGVIGEQV